jgi:reactive intermediate/imine deaminase
MSKKALLLDDAPKPAGPYSHGIVAGGFVFTAGFGPQDPATGDVVEGGVYEQTRQVLRNVQSVVTAAGASMDDVVKVTAHLQHLHGDFAEYNRAYAEFFTEPYPARAAFQVGALPRGAKVEIKAVARV